MWMCRGCFSCDAAFIHSVANVQCTLWREKHKRVMGSMAPWRGNGGPTWTEHVVGLIATLFSSDKERVRVTND